MRVVPIDLGSNGGFADIKHKQFSVNLGRFVGSVISNNYDPNPPYQRGKCWTDEMQIRLVLTILSGRKIPPIYLGDRQSCVAYKYIIDGKQRTDAFKRFHIGELAIPINYDGEVKHYNFNQIKEQVVKGNPAFQSLVDAWETYNIDVINYQGLTLEDQCVLFGDINTFMPINAQELYLGKNFYAKNIYKHVLGVCLKETGLIKHLASHKDILGNYREKGVVFISRICLLAFGPDLNGKFEYRNIATVLSGRHKPKNSDLVQGWENIHITCVKYMADKKDKNIEEFFPKLYPNIDKLKKLCKLLVAALESNNSAPKKLVQNDMLDIIVGLSRLIQHGVLTHSMIEAYPNEFRSLVAEYVKKKKEHPSELSSTSHDVKRIMMRMNLVEEIFNEMFDSGLKNKGILSRDRSIALLESQPMCPVNGVAITERNAEVDHANCKSINSQTTYDVLSDVANRQKSNMQSSRIGALAAHVNGKKKSS